MGGGDWHDICERANEGRGKASMVTKVHFILGEGEARGRVRRKGSNVMLQGRGTFIRALGTATSLT